MCITTTLHRLLQLLVAVCTALVQQSDLPPTIQDNLHQSPHRPTSSSQHILHQ